MLTTTKGNGGYGQRHYDKRFYDGSDVGNEFTKVNQTIIRGDSADNNLLQIRFGFGEVMARVSIFASAGSNDDSVSYNGTFTAYTNPISGQLSSDPSFTVGATGTAPVIYAASDGLREPCLEIELDNAGNAYYLLIETFPTRDSQTQGAAVSEFRFGAARF